MSHPLDGARLKVIRAQEHIDSLRAEIGIYLNSNPYSIVTKEQADASEHEFTVTSSPPPRLSAIIGDCVTNARAALDYIMWELAAKYFVPRFNGGSGNDRQIVSFPIDSTKGYGDHLKRLTHRQMPADAINAIKAAQQHIGPYGPILPRLQYLVNTDKHRTLLLVIGHLGAVTFHFAGPVSNIRHGGSVTIIPGGTTDVTINLGTPGTEIGTTKMEMNAQVAIYVTWKDSLMPPVRVDRTLEEIIKAVADIVPGFDRFF